MSDYDLLAELMNIANAKRFDRERFENDTAFADWAQSRARAAIAEFLKPAPAVLGEVA